MRLIDLIYQYQQIANQEFVKCGWFQRMLCFDHFWGAVDEFGHLCVELVWHSEKEVVEKRLLPLYK